MIANITIAKRTSKPICNNGAIAQSIDFSTTCKPAGSFQESNHIKANNFKKSFVFRFEIKAFMYRIASVIGSNEF